MDGAAPVFVLCYARSGSTLLRYVLDAHPAVCAPPELHLMLAARQLSWVHTHTAATPDHPLEAAARERYALDRTRDILTTTMSDYARRCGKRVWAEKSVSTIDTLDLLDKLFPNARLICLHRGALDTLASCMEAMQRRQGLFGFEPFVARTVGRPLDGLADYWIDKSRRLLACERDRPDRCIRLRYEALVENPPTILRGLFEFLGLEWEDAMVEEVFKRPHVVGPGDSKILETAKIESRSVGRGQRLPLAAITSERRRQIEALSAEIGHEIRAPSGAV